MGGMTIVDGYLFQTNGDGGVSVFCDGKRIAEIPSMTLDEVFALDDEDIDDLVFTNAVREKK